MSRIYSLYLQDVVEATERIASYVENVSQEPVMKHHFL